MTERPARQLAIRPPRTSGARVQAEQIAADLAAALGATSCCVMVAGVEGYRPWLVAYSARSDAVLWRRRAAADVLRQVRAEARPLTATVGRQAVLALPLLSETQPVGAIAFLADTPPDAAAARGAVALANRALTALQHAEPRADGFEDRAHLREIQVSRNLIRGVIDSLPTGLMLLDGEGVILAANRPLAQRFDLEPAALVGLGYASVGEWERAPALRAFQTGVAQRARRALNHPDGHQTLIEIAAIPLLDFEGTPRQVVEVWEDITERVALQTQLVRAEKLAAIGQLAASIAHEVGNPLQAIQGFLSLFLEQCPPETPNRRFLELADDEIVRIVDVLSRLRDLYRPRADVVEPVSLNALVEHVLLLTNKQLERGSIRVIRELSPALPNAPVVADQIKQVLLNLVLNAIDAMRHGGVLHVQTTLLRPHGESPVARIVVTDTGVGIGPEQLTHVFDGLHTSKERGMGLGLYTSKAIIDRHMGRIVVQSVRGEGTTFTITLPLRAEEIPE